MNSFIMYLPFTMMVGYVVIAVIFLIAVWRGMIAHESIAESLKSFVKQNKPE